ncbi:peptidoglycan DD-metalloendopeptidase family protein [Nocardioides pyridinolyticus]
MLRHLLTIASAAAVAATLAFACPASAATPATAITDARVQYRAELAQVSALSAQYQRVAATAAAAEGRAEELHAAVGEDDGGVVSAITSLFSPEPSDLDRAAEAAADAEDARALADLVHEELVDQIAEADTAHRAWERAERQRMRAEAALTAGEYAERAVEFARFPSAYAATDGDQDRLNHVALADWHTYLGSVADAAVVPPALADLADPDELPEGLEPARGSGFDLATGIAAAQRKDGAEVTVLSAETVRAVSEAFRRVGQATTGVATAYACGGLVAEVWAGPDLGTPADAFGQWDALAAVPTASVQLGDVVLLGSRRAGLTGTGIYVGADRAVVADAATGVAEVRPVTDLLAVRRVGVGGADPQPAAPEGGTCGVQPAAPVADGPFLVPVPATYFLTAGFGDAGSRWSSGAHTGLDFAAPTGTPVVAAAAGTVTVEQPGWAGSLVRIDHGNGMETWYAHLSRTDVVTGDVVEAGTPIGLVGEDGNSTGPHLHFEVRLDGTPCDPAPLLGWADTLR